MNLFQHHQTENAIEITIFNNNPKFAQIILITVDTIITLIPIFIIAIVFINHAGGPGLFFGLLIYIAIVWFPFTRIAFWSVYGTEHIIFKENEIEYYYHYKFYKSKLVIVETEALTIQFVNEVKDENNEIGNLSFLSNGKEVYQSTLKINKIDFTAFISKYKLTK